MNSTTPRMARAHYSAEESSCSQPTRDAATTLSALAVLNNTVFPSLADAVQAYLTLVMHYVGVRNAFVSHLDSEIMQVLGALDNDGCNVPADGVVPLQDTFCQYVRASGTPMVVTDAERDERVNNLATRTAFTIGSYLGVPLLFSDGHIYGTLCALDPQPRDFDQVHIDMMRIVARHIALLIERDQEANSSRAREDAIHIAQHRADEQTALLELVAHDLRNPLSSIQSYSEMLLNNFYTPLSQDQRDILMHSYRSTQYMNRLVNDLVDASAVKNNRLSVLFGSFHPVDLAQSVLQTCRPQAVLRGLWAHVEYEPNIPYVHSDVDRLRQILLNYMSNALRYTSTGSIRMAIAVHNQHVQFTVEDTGAGIPLAEQPFVWELHFRGKRQEHGLGVGLYIVKRLAQAIGGSVGFQSAPRQGSTFWVRVPIDSASDHHAAPWRGQRDG